MGVQKARLETIIDPNPSLGRIVIAGDWHGSVERARRLLQDICEIWTDGNHIDILITPGAFLTFDWPESLAHISEGRHPKDSVMDILIAAAEEQCNFLLNKTLMQSLLSHTRFMTIGIDSFKDKISLSNVSIRKPHVELVVLINLKTNEYFWTGKSYPTSGQENGLIRVDEIKSHFIKLPFGKIMILGCHDLKAFSRRGEATTKKKWRKEIRNNFYEFVEKESPNIVLHHPHTTDSARTWTDSWNELSHLSPSINRYISSGRYHNPKGERSALEQVLRKTKKGDTIDFIFRTGT